MVLRKSTSRILRWTILVSCVMGMRVPSADAQTAMPPGRRLALVIGNAKYTGIASLAHAANDAVDMEKELRSLGFDVDLVPDARRDGMVAAITRFQRTVQKTDEVVFYYAGHGGQVDGENYLLPINLPRWDTASMRAYGIDAEALAEQLARLARVAVVILDACRDNPSTSATRSGAGGLADMQNSASGAFIAFAAGAGKTASDGGANDRNGLFTSELLRAMKQPGLSVRDLFALVREQVASASRKTQIPAVYDHLIGQFVFRPGALSVSATVSPVTSVAGAVVPSGNGSRTATAVASDATRFPDWMIGNFYNEGWLSTTRAKLGWDLRINRAGGVVLTVSVVSSIRGLPPPVPPPQRCRLMPDGQQPHLLCTMSVATTTRTSRTVETSYALLPRPNGLALSPFSGGEPVEFEKLPDR